MGLSNCSSLLRAARSLSVALRCPATGSSYFNGASAATSQAGGNRCTPTVSSTAASSLRRGPALAQMAVGMFRTPISFGATCNTFPPSLTTFSITGDSIMSARAMSTDATEGEGEDEGEDTIPGVHDDEPPDDYGDEQDDVDEYEEAPEIDEMRLRGLRAEKRTFKTEFERTDDLRRQEAQDPTEFLLFAKEAFLKKDEKMIAIPPEVRRVMYKYSWDKLLIDVHRHLRRARFQKMVKMHAMVAVGNLQGLIGLGIGVDGVAQAAIAKAYLDAFNNLTYVPLYRGHTVYHKIEHKFSKINMSIWPRPHGWGFRGSDLMYELSHMVGLKNVSINMRGRRTKNRFFQAHCFVEALKKQTTPYDGVDYSGMYMRETFFRPTLPCDLKRGVDIP